MIPEKLKTLIELLIEKTIKKQAIWNKGSGSNQFKLLISQGAAITVTQWEQQYGSDKIDYGVNIFNSNGQAIEGFVSDNDTSKEELRLLQNFYKAASDQYYKVEETMEAILNSLTGDDVIGIKEDSIFNADDDKDDLPF